MTTATARTAVLTRPTRRIEFRPIENLRLEIPADELHRITDLKLASARAFRAACHHDDTAPDTVPNEKEAARLWNEWDRISDLYSEALQKARDIYQPFRVPHIPRGDHRCIMLPVVFVEV